MDEHHLAALQIAEFIVGGLDEDELDKVYWHFDECGECWAGGRASFGWPARFLADDNDIFSFEFRSVLKVACEL